MKKVLLIGQNGQVTRYLQSALKDEFDLMVADRHTLDLSQPEKVVAVLETLQPDIIVNPAAYTAVDLAEQESELAYTINRDAVAEIAKYCFTSNTSLVHFSTDYVFAGDASSPYTEVDTPAPTGVYGQSKLEGEQAILESGAPAIILRTSWVYSNHGKNFYKTMLNLAQSRNELSVVFDQVGAPTYAGSIADATKQLLQKIATQGGISEVQQGVYHFSCEGETNWCEFAKALFAANSLDMTVNAIPSIDYPTPAKRPAYSVLDGEKLNSVFGISLPNWDNALSACATETAEQAAAETKAG